MTANKGTHILAIDQGTTGSTALVMGTDGRTLGRANREFPQHFPQPGWVEHEPEQIWQSVERSVSEALEAAGVAGPEIGAIGITNQRETAVLWERDGGKPVHRAIVWQDRRTADRCAQLDKEGHRALIHERTGLVIDAYFSGTKVEWMLDNVDGARTRANAGELAFGTMDSFLVWRLSGGTVHATDVSNASRTLFMNLDDLSWNDELLDILRVPRAVLPTIVPSAGEIAVTKGVGFLPDGIPISGIAGDQQAALFGQACFETGDVKCTYGTGAFVVLNTGRKPILSKHNLLTTVGWQIGDDVVYALEGSSFIAGAAVQWLRDGLGIIEKASDIEALARSVSSSDGVVFVPALSGLGAPHWDARARGLISGMTRGTNKAHLARATLEAIALQVNDLIEAMREESPVHRLRVDGGAAANDLLMQLQSDFSGLTVERPEELETTARGAAMLAGIGAGIFKSGAEAAQMVKIRDTFSVQMGDADRKQHRERWNEAICRTRGRAVQHAGE